MSARTWSRTFIRCPRCEAPILDVDPSGDAAVVLWRFCPMCGRDLGKDDADRRTVSTGVLAQVHPWVEGEEHGDGSAHAFTLDAGDFFIRNLELCPACRAVRPRGWERGDYVKLIPVPSMAEAHGLPDAQLQFHVVTEER